MKEQLETLIEENEQLKKRILQLEDENQSLWFMLDEMKKSQDAIGEAVQRALVEQAEEALFNSFTVVGEA